MPFLIRRRDFMAGLGAGLLASPAIVRAQGQPIVIRAGALKLIHSIAPYFYDQFVPAGYKIEVLPFETPTECKNAVVTKSVDFGAFGIAAALLGAAAGEPVVVIASTCNRGMAIIAKKDAGIAAIKDLKGKRVAVFPGTTQEVFFLERLRMEGGYSDIRHWREMPKGGQFAAFEQPVLFVPEVGEFFRSVRKPPVS